MEKLVANHLLLVVGCIILFWLTLVRFELWRIFLQLKDKYIFSTPMKIYTMGRIVKKPNFFLSLLVT